MKRHALTIARVLGYGLLALISGGLSIWWLGHSWWSVLIACVLVFVTMLQVFASDEEPEVPDGEA